MIIQALGILAVRVAVLVSLLVKLDAIIVKLVSRLGTIVAQPKVSFFGVEMKQSLRCACTVIRPCLALTDKTRNDTKHEEILSLKAFLS